MGLYKEPQQFKALSLSLRTKSFIAGHMRVCVIVHKAISIIVSIHECCINSGRFGLSFKAISNFLVNEFRYH